MTYRQTMKNIIDDKTEYKQTRFHDYSVITTNIYLNEEYIKKMITKIYQQSEARPDAAPPYGHRLLMFLAQHYALKVPYLLQATTLSLRQCNQVLQHFDDYAGKHFQRVNTRPLSEIQRAQQLERLRPEPVHQGLRQCQEDITEEEDEDLLEDYDETRS
eukprot:752770-Amphidinium_carterae.1